MSDLVPFTGAELFQTCWFNKSDCAVPRRRLVGSVLVGFQRDASTSFRSLDSRQGLRARLHRRSLPQTFQGPSGAGLARQLAAWVWHGGPERAMWEKMDLFQLHLEHRKFFYHFSSSHDSLGCGNVVRSSAASGAATRKERSGNFIPSLNETGG